MKFRPFVSVALLVASGIFVVPASAGAETLLRGQDITVGRVYWIKQCQSILKRVTGVYPEGAPKGVAFELQPATVTTRQCGNSVPGALVVAKASKQAMPGDYSISYVVTYDTEDSNHSSNHTTSLTVR